MLEEALRSYNGSALIVSHDRYFISRVANRIVELKDGELLLYRGDYSYFLEKKAEEADEAAKVIELAKREANRIANRNRQRQQKKSKKKLN